MNEAGAKVCSKCKQEFPATSEYFWKDSTKKIGLGSQCKACRNPERRKKSSTANGYKKCTRCNLEFPATSEYYYKKKAGKYGLDSRCKACHVIYRKKNKERIKEYHKMNYVKNKEKITRRNSEWNRKNKISAVRRKQRRRSEKQNLESSLSDKQWKEIKSIFNYRCAYCGMAEVVHLKKHNEHLHQEHFVPISKGGEYTRNNIIPACRSCNASKHDANFFEWYPTYNKYNDKRENKILKYLGYKKYGIQQLNIL